MEARNQNQSKNEENHFGQISRFACCALMAMSCVIALDHLRMTGLADSTETSVVERPQNLAAQAGVELLSGQSPARAPIEAPRSVPPAPAPLTPDNPFPRGLKLPQDDPGVFHDFGASTQALRSITPAQRMTIRRDPQSQRILGNDGENGLSIKKVQEDLQRDAQNAAAPNMQLSFAMDAGWCTDLPYGKYIYIHHAPLLYEDIPVERYQDEFHPCLTPITTGLKFLGTTVILPYKVTTDYCAAKHYGGCYSYDYQGNLRPGILDGSFCPSHSAMRRYPTANLMGIIAQFAVVGGAVAILP